MFFAFKQSLILKQTNSGLLFGVSCSIRSSLIFRGLLESYSLSYLIPIQVRAWAVASRLPGIASVGFGRYDSSSLGSFPLTLRGSPVRSGLLWLVSGLRLPLPVNFFWNHRRSSGKSTGADCPNSLARTGDDRPRATPSAWMIKARKGTDC